MKLLPTMLAALFLLAVCPAGGRAAVPQVEQIQVVVADVSNSAGPPVLERMADSMFVVAEQVLAGKTFEHITQNRVVYATVLADVANRVFIGYNTETVEITVEQPLKIRISVRPWGEVTRAVRVDFHLSGVNEVWSEFIKEKLEKLSADVEQVLLGISVDAVDWAGVLAKKRIRDAVGQDMPYFKTTSDIFFTGDAVQTDIVLQPVGDAVQGVEYDLRSNTLPTVLLFESKKRLGDFCAKLRGLPIEFVMRHKTEIEEQIKTQAEKERIVSLYKLKTDVEITAQEDAQVTIRMDSDRYRFWLEGYVDVGRKKDVVSGQAHIGRLISRRDELFFEAVMHTEDVKWDFSPGLARYWGDATVSVLYRLPDKGMAFRLEYDFLKKWRFRSEKIKDFNRPEFALRYRLHDFLALEFVLGADKETYLRIVGNL